MPEPATDPEIRAESAYLAAARAALHAMHTEVVTTGTPELDGEEKDEIWHNTVYRLARERRAQDLVDLPDVPLFFGRLDYEPGTVYAAGSGSPTGTDRIYIGRRHVHDADGRPMVVDWRAPVSGPFYRATREDPQQVRLRRRYGFSAGEEPRGDRSRPETPAGQEPRGDRSRPETPAGQEPRGDRSRPGISAAVELTAYEDEPLAGPGEASGTTTAGAILTAEIERPRSGPMRDIVATIQPEQDDLVRAPLHPTLCIQGAPGTGKTAIGLHRLAYLLYTERERFGRGGVAVVGPNRSFLAYIRRVLPALGEVDVAQTTVEELLGHAAMPAGGEDPRAARVKGDARMAAVLHRALWSHVGTPEDGLLYKKGSYRYRVPQHQVAGAVAALRGTTRYGAGRLALAQRLAHLVLVQMERRGASPDDRDQAAVARSAPVKQLLAQVWPKLVPAQVLYRLWSDPDFLAGAAEEDLTPAERSVLGWDKPYPSWRSAKWTAADGVLLDELAGLIERVPTIGHLVIDEAQDLSPMQGRALGRRCADGSLTVLGDLAQGTTPWAAGDWPALLAHLGKPDARLAVLEQGFRVPAQIIDYAARLLPEIAPGLGAPRSVRQHPGALRVTGAADLLAALVPACRDGLAGAGSVGLIAADADITAIYERLLAEGLDTTLLGAGEGSMEDTRLVCVPASLAKGLEFDAVVVAEPARIVAAEPRGAHRLYVVLTRAVSSLHVVHADPLPAALAQP